MIGKWKQLFKKIQDLFYLYFHSQIVECAGMYTRNESCNWQRNVLMLTCKKAGPRETWYSNIMPLYLSIWITPFWFQDKTVLQLKDVGVWYRFLSYRYMSKGHSQHFGFTVITGVNMNPKHCPNI